MTNKSRLGPSGFCICPKCSYKAPHRRGTPCQEIKCPNCGAKLLREGAYHHQLFEKEERKTTEKLMIGEPIKSSHCVSVEEIRMLMTNADLWEVEHEENKSEYK